MRFVFQCRLRFFGNYFLKIPAQVRITVFDDGVEGKDLPTGFNADVEGRLWSSFEFKSKNVKINFSDRSV